MQTASAIAPLTPRERVTLVWFSHGLTAQGVAEMMGIGEETVKSHIAIARLKLQAKNTPHAVANALRLGIIA